MTLQLHDLILQLHDPALQLRDLTLQLRDLLLRIHDQILQLHDQILQLCDLSLWINNLCLLRFMFILQDVDPELRLFDLPLHLPDNGLCLFEPTHFFNSRICKTENKAEIVVRNVEG